MTMPFGNDYSTPLLQEPAVSATQRVIDKWFELQPATNAVAPNIARAFKTRDLQRLAAGQQTDSVNETLRAMVAAQQGRTLTERPEPPLTAVHKNFLRNARELVTSIPKIPSALIEEVRDLPHAGERIQQNLANGDNPIEAIAKAPGVRFLPGAYLVGNAAGGHFDELARNPLFSILDALPAAGKIAELTPAAKIAKAQSIEGLANRPLKAALTRKVIEAPGGVETIGPNAIGRAINTLADTDSGQIVRRAVGKEARKMMRTINFDDVALAQALDPGMPVPSMFESHGLDVVRTTRASTELLDKYPMLKDRQYAADTFQKATLGKWSDMDTNQLAIVHEARDISNSYAAEMLIRGELGSLDGEIYDMETYRRNIKNLKKGRPLEAPARWYPLIEELARNVRNGEQMVVVPSDVASYVQQVVDAKWGAFTDTASLKELAQTIEPTWTAMRDAGLDPVFIHRVPNNRAAHIAAPKINEVPISPAQVRKRTFDFEPHHNDIVLGLQHQGIELLQQLGAEHLIEQLRTQAGRTKAQLMDEYAPQVDSLLSRMDPRIADRNTALDVIIRRKWTPFNPELHGFNWKSAKFQRLTDENWYLPKYLADNLTLWRTPKMSSMARLWDPVMGVFRTTLLALRPNWHVNNAIGGGIATAVEAGPTSFRFMRQAMKMVHNPAMLPEELRFIMRSQRNVFNEMNYRVGRTLGRTFTESGNARLARAATDVVEGRGVAGHVRTGFNKVVDSSYRANQWVDEVYRVMGYLQGKHKARKLGADAAEKAGLELAGKVLQQWADMTPWERSTLRFVFPFYGWIQHVTRFALRYPADHPLRASIFASIARAELEDLGSGLPERFLDAFFLGSPDPNGNVKAFIPGGLNPFRDVPDYFTVAGFLSATNPLIATALEQAGFIDGRTEAYPTLRYDETTGQMVADTPSLGGSLVKNIIPQTELFSVLIGANKDFHELMRTDPEAGIEMIDFSDPEAARRRMLSLGGIPFPIRTINVPQEIGRHELTLNRAQTTAFNEALRTGSDDYAKQFPGLQSVLSQLREMQRSGKLNAYQPLPMSTLSQLNLAGGV